MNGAARRRPSPAWPIGWNSVYRDSINSIDREYRLATMGLELGEPEGADYDKCARRNSSEKRGSERKESNSGSDFRKTVQSF